MKYYKGVYKFPDLSEVVVKYFPEKSNEKEVYVEWVDCSKVVHTMYLSPKGLRYKC